MGNIFELLKVFENIKLSQMQRHLNNILKHVQVQNYFILQT